MRSKGRGRMLEHRVVSGLRGIRRRRLASAHGWAHAAFSPGSRAVAVSAFRRLGALTFRRLAGSPFSRFGVSAFRRFSVSVGARAPCFSFGSGPAPPVCTTPSAENTACPQSHFSKRSQMSPIRPQVSRRPVVVTGPRARFALPCGCHWRLDRQCSFLNPVRPYLYAGCRWQLAASADPVRPIRCSAPPPVPRGPAEFSTTRLLLHETRFTKSGWPKCYLTRCRQAL